MRRTKTETRKFREDWRAAVSEGRVLRFGPVPEGVSLQGLWCTSYPTLAARDVALAEAEAAGLPVAIVEGA